MNPSSPTYTIRRATEADLAEVLRLRVAMFEAMPHQSSDRLPELEKANLAYLTRALPNGEYLAWVAEVEGRTVGAGGMVMRYTPPTVTNLTGKEGYILSIYTEPEWRGKGVASAIIQAILDYLRASGIPKASLRCREEVRPLYEKLGFNPGEEMVVYLDE
jgi:ribosomal protein S18 acetylase RimI-like enzyme